MPTTKILLIITGVAAALCIGAIVASGSTPVSDAGGRPDWDAFGRQVNLIIFVAIPAGIIASVAGFTALGTYFIDKQSEGKKSKQ